MSGEKPKPVAPTYAELLEAAREFKYLIEIQRPGVMVCPAAGGKWMPLSKSENFRRACAIFEAADLAQGQ